MKLLNSYVSPFAARVRIGIYAKALPVEIAPSGQWTADWRKSPDYLVINPIGRVPTLVLDDGTAVPESSVILEYLADAFPQSGLRPAEASLAARARLLAHLVEIYVQIPAGPLFGQLFAPERNTGVIEGALVQMREGLGHLEHFIEDGPYAVGDQLTLADCALAPFLFFFADRMGEVLGGGSLLEDRPRLKAYWARISLDPAVARVLDEMREAIARSPMAALVSQASGA